MHINWFGQHTPRSKMTNSKGSGKYCGICSHCSWIQRITIGLINNNKIKKKILRQAGSLSQPFFHVLSPTFLEPEPSLLLSLDCPLAVPACTATSVRQKIYRISLGKQIALHPIAFLLCSLLLNLTSQWFSNTPNNEILFSDSISCRSPVHKTSTA